MKKRLFLVVFLFLALFLCSCKKTTSENGEIEVRVYNFDSEEVFSGKINFTKDDNLVDLLKNHETIKMKVEEFSFGYFIVEMVGINANNYQNAFWNIKVNGEDSLVGVNEIKLHDGDVIEFALISWE